MSEKKVNNMIHTSLIHKEMLHSVKKQSREIKTSDKYTNILTIRKEYRVHLTYLNPTISPFLQDGDDVIWHSP